MIVVKVELHSARTGIVTELGRMNIINNGTSQNPLRGNYGVEVLRKGTLNKISRTGQVLNWPRRSYVIWRLVSRALRSAFPEEK